MRLSKTQMKILQVASGGAFGLGILISLIASFAFNSETFYHDDKLGMEFGMGLDMETQDTYVWMRVPQVLLIKTTILSVHKINAEGDADTETVPITALFPMSGSECGAVEVMIEILAADDDQMPDLSAHDQKVKPMGYVSEKSRPPLIQRYFMIFFAWAIQHWTMVKVVTYASAVAMIITGVIMRHRNKKKIQANLVVEMKGTLFGQ